MSAATNGRNGRDGGDGRDRGDPIPNAPDVILIGGGLAACLIALRLGETRPDLSLLMIERAERIAGDQLWSFHDTDLDAEAETWIRPLVSHRWPSQRVVFPARRRSLRTGYNTIGSDSLREAIEALPNVRTVTRSEASVTPGGVTFADGERVPAPLVIDARGQELVDGTAGRGGLVLAWQKFVGLVVDVPEGHGVSEPVIMDATVPQLDGFRFVYLLPQDERRILIEDTRYADGPALDREGMRGAILDYAAGRGWSLGGELHAESGVLPIALAHDARAAWRAMPRDAVPVGMRAGLFHAMTGYSFPLAVRVADLVASSPELTTRAVFERVRAHALAEHRRQWFFRFLARMLFRGAAPDHRWFVMQRFYGLGEGLIERFYAGRLTWRDKLRIVSGRPPIPIHRGLRCMPERPLLRELR